jgi:hypothetical protein
MQNSDPAPNFALKTHISTHLRSHFAVKVPRDRFPYLAVTPMGTIKTFSREACRKTYHFFRCFRGFWRILSAFFICKSHISDRKSAFFKINKDRKNDEKKKKKKKKSHLKSKEKKPLQASKTLKKNTKTPQKTPKSSKNASKTPQNP